MAIYQLPTGTYETRAAFALRGGSFRDKRQFAATAILVRHPKGDFLIDAGFGADVAAHVAMQPRFARAPFQSTRTVREQLDDSDYDRTRLRGVFLTHTHWDHASGLDSLDLPIWMNRGELEYAASDGDGKVFRAVLPGDEIHEYSFDGPAYLGFSASFDVHGDGSLVLALAGGHTTGSVVAFVTLPSGQRYAFIGDLTWQLDGIHRRVERPLAATGPRRQRRRTGATGHPAIGRADRADAGRPRPRPARLRGNPAAAGCGAMTAGPAPSLDSEITWLLHRAAQRMHVVTGEQAERHGLHLRDYIVLSALDKTPGLTQVELAKANLLGSTRPP